MKTYPAMNQEIVELLRISKRPHHLYAAQRIEELEKQVKDLQVARRNLAAELTLSAIRSYDTCKMFEAKIDKLEKLLKT